MKNENCCPWCGHEIQDIWEYGLDDGDQHETECPSCNKKIEIGCSVSWHYEILARGCEKHRFEIGDYWYPGADFLNLKCVDCKNEFYDNTLAGGKYQRLTRDQYEFVGRAKVEAEKRGLL